MGGNGQKNIKIDHQDLRLLEICLKMGKFGIKNSKIFAAFWHQGLLSANGNYLSVGKRQLPSAMPGINWTKPDHQ